MGQYEGKKCKNVRESSTRSKRQELTANVGYPLLETVPVTDTSEILSRTGLKSVRNAYTGFEQVGLAVYTVLKKHECIPVGCVSPALYRTRGRGSLSRVVSVQRESLFGDRLCLGVGVSLSQGSLSRGV